MASHSSDFYPRPPRGGRRRDLDAPIILHQFLSTPSARRATKVYGCEFARHEISIHALREEGDPLQNFGIGINRNFYPRPPRGGRRSCECRFPDRCYFYPRPPRGGRQEAASWSMLQSYFYPRPPRGGRHMLTGAHPCGHRISIHALREEGDVFTLASAALL